MAKSMLKMCMKVSEGLFAAACIYVLSIVCLLHCLLFMIPVEFKFLYIKVLLIIFWMPWQIIKNEDLEELRELGSGTYGTVYHGKWRGTDVAIKRIKKSCFTGGSSEQERLVSFLSFSVLSNCFFSCKNDKLSTWRVSPEDFCCNNQISAVYLTFNFYINIIN